MRYYLITLLLTLISPLAKSQSAKEILGIANSASIQTSGYFYEIPFEDRFSYFIVPVTIGTESYEYIFDTGGYNTFTSDIMEKNDIEEILKAEIGSANQIKSKVAMGKIEKLSIGELTVEEVGAFNFDFDEAPAIKCYTNGGLIGKGVIKEAIWQIDYDKKLIRVSDDLEQMPHLEGAIKMNVRLDKTYNPFIKAKLNGKVVEFMLDYGFGGFVSLTEKSAGKYLENPGTEVNGEGTVGANGVSEDNVFYSPIEALEIGDQNFSEQIAFYSKPNNYNLIGSDLSKYFIVTLNFQKKELYLTPYNSKEEPIQIFGFDLNRDENGTYVNRIHSNGSAEIAGLKLGDRVSTLNGVELDSMDYCDFYFYTTEMRKSEQDIELQIVGENARLLKISKSAVKNTATSY